jgi:hypothetical protein
MAMRAEKLKRRSPMPCVSIAPRRAGPSPRGEATQGALLTTVFSYVYGVCSKDIEWAALAFTNQLTQRDQSMASPLTVNKALKIIRELELPIRGQACRTLLTELRDASYQRRGMEVPHDPRSLLWDTSSPIDFRDTFCEALFRIALLHGGGMEHDPQEALLYFFDVYRFKDRRYILEVCRYNTNHSCDPRTHYNNNTLQYLPMSTGASLGKFSSEYLKKHCAGAFQQEPAGLTASASAVRPVQTRHRLLVPSHAAPTSKSTYRARRAEQARVRDEMVYVSGYP